MAQIALRKTAAEGENHSPSAAKTLKENSYMDDILDSVQTVSEARQLTTEIDEVLAKGGFSIKEWQSNRDLKDTGDKQNEWTKRSILSQIARIYDPVGFAAAFLIRAKIGFQELWQQGYEWDQDLPSAVQEKWLSLFKEMKGLNEVSFPRSLSPPEPADSQPTLCVFADASQDAFGACAYIRWAVEKDKFDIRFIAAKSRVAPLKKITIPRLELQAAVLASRLQATIKEESRFQFKETVIFTDSAIVLAWVRGKIRRYKPFVSSRIGEIQSQTDPEQWKHIPSRHNVADDVSRGIVVTELSGRWQSGPDFLRLPKEQWPQRET
ncbi:uncharacterized protein [Montipora foliosa]|uniref:uncharacterized protein n=1 Tax=Montipora foliosa TaxID=591990 RepID=UPI0035F21A23